MPRSIEKIIISILINKYRKGFLLVLISSTFAYLLSIAAPLSFMAIIDRVLISEGYATLNVILIILFLVAIAEFFIKVLSSKLSLWINSAHISETSHFFFSKLFTLKKNEFDKLSVGETISRLGELDKIKSYISDWLSRLTLDLIFMVIFFIVIYSLNSTLTFLLLATVPLHLAQYFLFQKKIKSTQKTMFSANIDYQNRVIESVTAFDTLRSHRKSSSILDRIYSSFDTKLQKGYELAGISIWSSQLSALINNLSEALILFAGATFVLDQSMTLGALVAFNMMKGRVTDPLLRLASIWEEIIAFRISLDRVNVIMNAESEVPSSSLQSLSKLENCISFRQVGFAYQPTEAVLEHLDLSIPINHTLCILGESGAGKSTVAKLIAGEYDHYQGKIYFDDIDLKLISLASLREQIAVVQQHSILLAGTIADNILFDSNFDDLEWMENAAKLADIHDFICNLPLGYNTVVTEQGHNFSGGQIQRIALARAFASDKPILILDEATSALDYETEANIVNNLEQFKHKKTIIIITHRLSLARLSDSIVYMQGGRIIENGSHQDLLEIDSFYKKLYNYQLGGISPLVLESVGEK